jgi:hypothetical protein
MGMCNASYSGTVAVGRLPQMVPSMVAMIRKQPVTFAQLDAAPCKLCNLEVRPHLLETISTRLAAVAVSLT